jgi:type-F conjugative transfer system secretin TraK
MKKLLLSFLLLLPFTAFSAQIREVVDGSELAFNISIRDLNRVKVIGDRVQTLKCPEDEIILSAIENLGEIYIRPIKEGGMSISCFMITEKGNTYKIRFTPKDIASTQIILKNIENIPVSTSANESTNLIGEKSDIVELMKLMSSGTIQSNDKYKISSINGVWFTAKEIEAKKTLLFQGEHLTGMVLNVKNKSDLELKISEKTFFKEGVRAVSIENNVIQPNSSVSLYIVLK